MEIGRHSCSGDDAIAMQQSASTAIRGESLSKTYRLSKGRRIEALRSVSIAAPRGTCVVVEGPSGSGKSTLLNLLGCLDRPSSGQYYLGEENVAKMEDDQLSDIRSRYLG